MNKEVNIGLDKLLSVGGIIVSIVVTFTITQVTVYFQGLRQQEILEQQQVMADKVQDLQVNMEHVLTLLGEGGRNDTLSMTLTPPNEQP